MRLGLACLILVTGCDLYFTGGDDDDCAFEATSIAAEELRNPDTGQCEPFGFGGCDNPCEPCVAEADPGQLPDWGSCFAGCESFDETSCISQPGCRAVYDANSDVDEPPRFHECWAIAPSGPAPGSCEDLDAYECSRHENCSAYYDDTSGFMTFSSCKTETALGCFGDEECGPTAHCSTSDGECLPPPGCEEGETCPAVCYGKCISDGDVCSNVSCAPGSHCEAQCSGCDGANGPCDPSCQPVCVPDQDACTAITCGPGFECVETCQSIDPNNPGCGICDAACVPVGTCESLPDETTCTGRADCRAVYLGESCTCYSNGTCNCEVLTYERCETK
jgi:hypothetical protein